MFVAQVFLRRPSSLPAARPPTCSSLAGYPNPAGRPGSRSLRSSLPSSVSLLLVLAQIRAPALFLLLGLLSFPAVLPFLANLGQTSQPIAFVDFSQERTWFESLSLCPPSTLASGGLTRPSASHGEMTPTRDEVPPKRREERRTPHRRLAAAPEGVPVRCGPSNRILCGR